MDSITIMKQNKKQRKNIAGRLGVILFWLAVWQIIYKCVGRDLLFASPASVLRRIVELAATWEFWRIIATSLCRIMSGFLLGLLFGSILGVVTARWNPVHQLMKLPLSIIRSTPVASFVILALIWISGRNLSTFISFLMVLPIAQENVHQGLKHYDPLLLETAKVYHLSRIQTIRVVYLPAVMPYFLSACRVAIGFAWKSGIAGEVLAIPKDAIGTQLYNAKIYLETTDLFAWTAVIILLSVLLEKLVTKLPEAAAARWGGTSRSGAQETVQEYAAEHHERTQESGRTDHANYYKNTHENVREESADENLSE